MADSKKASKKKGASKKAASKKSADGKAPKKKASGAKAAKAEPAEPSPSAAKSKGGASASGARRSFSLTAKQAAFHLGLAYSTLKRLRQTGNGPKCRLHGRTWRYHIADIEAWSAARARGGHHG